MSDISLHFIVILLLCGTASVAFGELSVPSIFNDGMVLQRGNTGMGHLGSRIRRRHML